MKVILFGATGMVGQGVLRECLQAQDVERVLVIRPLHGIRSKTRLYRAAYTMMRPLFPLLGALGTLTTTENVGRAMLRVARSGSPRPILDNHDIDRLAA